MLEANQNDTYGPPPPSKEDNTIRMILNNVNGLRLFSDEGEKIGNIEATRKKYGADVYFSVENWIQWDMAASNQKFDDLFGIGEDRACSVGFNRHDRLSGAGKDGKVQPGGTSILVTGRASGYASQSRMDDDSLGMWCSIRLGTETNATWLCCVYNPPESTKYRSLPSHRTYTVYSQRRRVLRDKGIETDPFLYFREQLVKQLLEWKNTGANIILAGDFNEDVYDGILAKRLQQEDLLMTCQFQASNGERLPNSHQSGTLPVMAIFATSGITCTNAHAGAHGANVGDHRLLIYDFQAPTVLGTHLPHMSRPSGRGVRSQIPRQRIAYTDTINGLNRRHRLLHRLNSIMSNPHLSRHQKIFHVNRWDIQFVQHQKCAESRSNKGGNRNVAFCDESTALLRKMRCLAWVKRYLEGKVPDGRNLFKQCKKLGVKLPRETTIEEVERERHECICILEYERESYHAKRPAFLLGRLVAAKRRQDDDATQQIKRIIAKENRKKRFQQLRYAMGRHKAAPLCEVKVPVEDPLAPALHFTTKESVHQATGECIRDRYQLGLRSPFNRGQLGQDVGQQGEGPVVQQILDGTYQFPPDTPPEVEALLQEAATLYEATKDVPFNLQITAEEFQYWWTHCRADTQSSKSGIHYDHYVCAAHDDELTELHVAKMNAVLTLGLPLDRWLSTVIVLLQKEMGTVFINKLRAICLFEADFNYVLKVIFSQRMMRNLNDNKLLPAEQHAKIHSGAKNATMNRILWQDVHRTNHHPYAISSVDLGDCYDSLHHGWGSISLQAAGVPKHFVGLMLLSMQSMGWFLRTGFGLSDTPFRGSDDSPMMGLGQGSSAAAPAFSVTSLLQTRAYHRLGHCEPMYSAWSGMLLLLAAVIYVDDTDLLVRARSRTMSDADFFNQIQASLLAWGAVVMATGGHLKQKKCKVSVVSFHFKKGIATIKPPSLLPMHSFVIPQHDSEPVPIPLLPPGEANEALGTNVAANGDGKAQLAEIHRKGIEWTDRLSTSRLKPIDRWLSLNIHLKPRICWNIVAVCGSPADVDASLTKVFTRALPYLKVNRKIRRTWVHLSHKYQGLGVFDINIERLSQKLFWIQRYWGYSGLEGEMLLHSFETFCIDLGFDGNPLACSFQRFGHLASNSWWKDLWELLDHFDVRLEIDESLLFKHYRDGDISLMRWFAESGQIPHDQLASLNRVRKHKCLFFLSELCACDGKSVIVPLLDGSAGNSTHKVYPIEKPTSKDITLWYTAIHNLCPGMVTTRRLGHFVNEATHFEWFWNEEENILIRQHHQPSSIEYFQIDPTSTVTRRRRFLPDPIVPTQPLPSPTHLATVQTRSNPPTLLLHSTAQLPRTPTSPKTFLDQLQSYGNSSLWETLEMDGDGTWIIDSIRNGTLAGACDGSYQVDIANDICSAGFMLIDTDTSKSIRGSWAEKSMYAGNYRGEIFGGMALSLLLLAAESFLPENATVPPVSLWIDNSGVIHHGSKPNADLLEQQPQADVLCLLKRYLRKLRLNVRFEKVDSHVDDYLPAYLLSVQERWNIEMDRLAKAALLEAHRTNTFIAPGFPFETFTVYTGQQQISGSTKVAIYDWHGYKTAKHLFQARNIVSADLFDTIYWEGMSKAIKKFPPTFLAWICKHVSHFCGTNRHLARIDHSVINVCPSCGQENESTSHITRCSDPDRIASLELSVDALEKWMDDNDTCQSLQGFVINYLKGRGLVSMTELVELEDDPDIHSFAQVHDELGWDNFVEGRISKSLVNLQSAYLSSIETNVRLPTWASGFMRQLLILTHQQWLYRNAIVHYKEDGRSLPQHEEILRTVESLIHTNVDDLPPEDQHLLDIDFEQLGQGPTQDQERWIIDMNNAIKIGRLHSCRHSGRVRRPPIRGRSTSPSAANNSDSSSSSDSTYSPSDSSDDERSISSAQSAPVLTSRAYITSYFAPLRDTEGSLKYRRRKRRH